MPWLTLILFLIIGGRILFRWIFSPFGGDELAITLKILREGVASLSLGSPELHPASGILTWICLKLLPPPVYSSRMVGAIPAVIFSLLLLLYLRKATANIFSPVSQLLCLVPFAVSPVFLFHSISLKGYSVMMLGGLALTVMPTLKRANLEIPLFLIVALSPLVHSFMGILALSSVLAQYLWVWLHRRSFCETEFRITKRLLKWQSFAALPCLFFLALQAAALNQRHELGGGLVQAHFSFFFLPYVVGIENQFIDLSFALFLLGLLTHNLWLKRPDYLTLWILTASGLFTLLYLIFRPTFLAGRFFLGILPVLILWTLTTINTMPAGIKKNLARAAFVFSYIAACGPRGAIPIPHHGDT